MKQPKVSIIILNWNGFEDTIECLESLKKITYTNYEIIIVDNASSGDDVRILKEKYGDYIHMIANDQNYGFPEGCNIGMRHALEGGAEYLLLLNNDTIVDREFLTVMVQVAENDPLCGIAGSKVYYYHYPNRIQAAGGRIFWWLGIIWTYTAREDVGQYDNIAERSFVFGTSFLVKKSVIDKIGFMDSYYFFGIEEFDYCTRAKRAGFKIMYVPQSKIWHKAGASKAKLLQFPETAHLIRTKEGTGQYKFYYRLFRTYGPPLFFIFPFLVAASSLGTLIVLIIQGDWKTIWGGIKRRVRLLLRASSKSRLPN